MKQPDSWAVDAAKLPLAFAQTREDASLDLSVLDMLPKRPDVVMIASGGCTSAALIASGRLGSLHLVDMNPAQIALAKMKIHLLATATPQQRMMLLGHSEMPVRARKDQLAAFLESERLAADTFGPLAVVSAFGPDKCGRFERVFARLQRELQGLPLDAFLHGTAGALNIEAMSAGSRDRFVGRLTAAFEKVMTLPNLVALFGPEATSNRVMPFAQHFATRTLGALKVMPAVGNPYLTEVLLGRFSKSVPLPWLSMPVVSSADMPPVTFSSRPVSAPADAPFGMRQVLEQQRESYDFVHLSNILDWLTPEDAARTLAAAHGALRKGGLVLIRQLNSTLAVRTCHDGFVWLDKQSEQMLAADRSYFYRSIHLGVKA